MKKEGETGMIPGVKLKVKESPIRFGGSVRVHDSVITKLGCEAKDQIVLMNVDDKKILRTIFADDFVAKDTVILRTKAMKDLDVKDGDEITLQLNKKILENLKNKAGDFKDDVKEKFKGLKEDVKEKSEDLKDDVEDFKDDVKKKSKDLKDDVKEKSEDFKDDVKKKSKDLKEDVKKKSEDFKDDVKKKLSKDKDKEE